MPDRKKLCQMKITMPDVFFLCQMPQNYARSGIHYAKLRPLDQRRAKKKSKSKQEKRWRPGGKQTNQIDVRKQENKCLRLQYSSRKKDRKGGGGWCVEGE